MKGWALVMLGRYDEAEQCGRQALALMEQVSETDPRNAAFRMDLSDVQFGLGTLLFNSGRPAGVMENLTRALAIEEQQAASQPGNPDFRLQTAQTRTGMGDVAAASGDSHAALTHHREAESMYRRLIREHPGEKAYLRRLAAQLPLVADSMAGAGNRSAAIPIYQESVALWKRLCRESDAEEGNWLGLAKARASLAQGFDGIGRKDDAIAEDLAAIALFDRVIAAAGKPRTVQISRAETYSHLSEVYRSRTDWKAAVGASLQALLFREADYAARPGLNLAMSKLWQTNHLLRKDYTILADYTRAIAAGRRCVEVAEKYVAAKPEDQGGLGILGLSYNNLGATYRLSGRRAESLAAYRKVLTLYDSIPLEKVNLFDRLTAANVFLFVAQGLRALEEQGDALPLCRKVVPVLEALVQGDPKNEYNRTALRKAYEVSGNVSGDLNDFAAYIEMHSKKFYLEGTQATAEFWRTAGLTKFDISSAEDLTGNIEAAAQSRREAVDLLQRSRSLAQTAVNASKLDLAALRDLITADKWIGFVSERSGDLKTALAYRREALSHARELAAADSRTAANRELFADSAGAFARVQSLIGSRLAPARSEVARGWRVYSFECTSNSAYTCEEETLKAVEIDRALVVENPRPETQLSLALDLQRAGRVYLITSRGANGSARQAALQRSRLAYAESRQILTDLQGAGTLPAVDQNRIAIIAEAIENVDAKLVQAQGANLTRAR